MDENDTSRPAEPRKLDWPSSIRNRFALDYAAAAVEAEQRNEPADALARLEEACEREPHNVDFRLQLGQLYFQRRQFDDAVDTFRGALKLDFTNLAAWKGLGFSQHERGKPGEAIYCYLKYIELNPHDADVQSNLVEAFAASGSFEEAIRVAEHGCRAFPDDGCVFHLLAARCRFDIGELDNAMTHLQQADERDCGIAEIYNLMGTIRAVQGDFESALKQYQRALALDAGNASAHLNSGRVFARTGRYEEYLAAVQRAIALYGEGADAETLSRAYWEEGWAYIRLERWQESIESSRKAVALNASTAAVRFNLALALLHSGDKAQALAQYEAAVALDDIGSLQHDGIHDLREALKRRPDLEGGKEILERLMKAHALAMARHPDLLSTM